MKTMIPERVTGERGEGCQKGKEGEENIETETESQQRKSVARRRTRKHVEPEEETYT